MTQYRYQRLPRGHGNIRLLRLLPHDDEAAPVECCLMNYSIQDHGRTSHLYEALSYVWGTAEDKPLILVDGAILDVTQNLHAALRRLRDPQLERILWVDAICINQDDLDERAEQVQYMTKIYRCANRVLVWLGPEADGSERAVDAICAAAQERVRSVGDELRTPSVTCQLWDDDMHSSFDANDSIAQEDGDDDSRIILEEDDEWKTGKSIHLNDCGTAILALLNRRWFRRVWILQEMAAARVISIFCGPSELSGRSLSLGLEAIGLSHPEFEGIRRRISSAMYLTDGSGFHMRSTQNLESPSRLDISPLPQLIDMFHTHDATDRRDKVYALLGMSCAIPDTAGLRPNYRIQWQELFRRLIAYSLGPGQTATIQTSSGEELAAWIRSKACILGRVTSIKSTSKGQQSVLVECSHFCHVSEGGRAKKITRLLELWLHSTAKDIHEDDILCLLQGTQVPMIIRPYLDHFSIIVIAAQPRQYLTRESEGDEETHEWLPFRIIWSDFVALVTSFPRKILLTWTWNETAHNAIDHIERSDEIRPPARDNIEKSEDLSNTARILENMGTFAYLEMSIEKILKRIATDKHLVMQEQLRMLQVYHDFVYYDSFHTSIVTSDSGPKAMILDVLCRRQMLEKSSFDDSTPQSSQSWSQHIHMHKPDLLEIRELLKTDTEFAQEILLAAKEQELASSGHSPSRLPILLALFPHLIPMDMTVSTLVEIFTAYDRCLCHSSGLLNQVAKFGKASPEWLHEFFTHLFDHGSREASVTFAVLSAAAADYEAFLDELAEGSLPDIKLLEICRYWFQYALHDPLLDIMYDRYRLKDLLPWLGLKKLMDTEGRDDTEALAKLLRQTPCPRLADGLGYDLLRMAALKNLRTVAKSLLSTGQVDLYAKSEPHKRETPLRIAVRLGHVEICELLLRPGASTREEIAEAMTIKTETTASRHRKALEMVERAWRSQGPRGDLRGSSTPQWRTLK